MDLVEVTVLINHPEVMKDEAILNMYLRKRKELVEAINQDLAKMGLGPFTTKELLRMSPNPALADTID
ncbi:hypothetical protein LCGC14_2703050 [marine sediment metagenome]|uniref:Uncharacterized protein n=1 Tax=marine sediment metagenome TaxID=412755 RepID=A0A0F8ZF44_9ZZZZ